MKKLLLAIFCIISVAANAQLPKNINTFHFVDANTSAVVPYVSVSILRAKLAITTEADGVLHIPGNLAAMRDTIIFYAQNYVTLKLPLNKLATMKLIPLTKTAVIPKTVTGKFSQKLILNNYVVDDIGQYAGVPTEDAPFNYLQIAQQFTANSPDSKLTALVINKSSDWMSTKYRIRIYDVDPTTGGPGVDLCDRIIDQDNEEALSAYLGRSLGQSPLPNSVANLDLKKYNIIIPYKSFFVAVEWLRDFLNATKVPVYNKATSKVDTAIVFRPYIGISPVKGNKLNIWVLQPDHKWKTYDHFYPFGTDLAIKATIEY